MRRAARQLGDAARFVAFGALVVVRGAAGLLRVARGGGLARALRPWMRAARAEDIPFERLAADGVRAVLFDLENTLVPPGGPFGEGARAVLARARAAGLRVGVVTNASASWVREALRAEGVPHVAPAAKPGRDGFRRACAALGVAPSEAVFVGDQLVTDVFGAQRAGLRAILLEPRWGGEAASARFQRAVSRALLRLAGEGAR